MTTPLDWHVFGTISRGRLERKSDLPHAGAQCLLMENITGDGGWESQPVAVEADKPYVLCWSVKAIGPGGFREPGPRDEAQRRAFAFAQTLLPDNPEGRPFLWYYFVDFIGLELLWLDGQGQALTTQAKPMAVEPYSGLVGSPAFFEHLPRRDDMSVDWTPVWLSCPPPPEARRLVARFRVVSRGESDAGVALGDVRLVEPPSDRPAKGMMRLVIRTLDAESGRCVPARLSVRDRAGRHFAPEHSFTVRAAFDDNLQFFYSLGGQASIDVPHGQYNVEAVAGPECEVAVAQADYVREGMTDQIDLEIVRRLDLRRQGWHGGDHHLHTSGHARRDYPMMDALTGLSLAGADGMDFVPFQAEYLDYDTHGAQRLEAGGVVGAYSTEICTLWGHFCLISVGQPVPLPQRDMMIYPMTYDLLRAVHLQGGASMAAHPHQMICQPFNTVYQRQDHASAIATPGRFNCARELPLILLLGEPCGYDLLIADGAGVGAMATREYYRLLEFGFRVPCGGSSDTGINSARSLFPSCRTFVRAASNELADIAQGYRGGRTFATNGPVMLVDADGAGIGDTLRARPGQEIRVNVRAFSPWGLEFVEVLFNGRPVARRELAGHDDAQVELPLTLREPGWLAVVLRGPSSRWVNSTMWPSVSCQKDRGRLGQIAHSSPIYIRFSDRPLVPGRQIADYYRRWMDSLLKIAEHYRPRLGEDARRAGIAPAEAWDIVTGRIDHCRARIDELAKHGWGD